jgi:hypothetical protein
MENDRDIESLSDVIGEVFTASTTSWAYQVMYHLMDRNWFSGDVIAYGIKESELIPLRAAETLGSRYENREWLFSSELEKKINLVETAMNRVCTTKEEYRVLLNNVLQGLIIIATSGDRENTKTESRDRDTVRKKIERIKEGGDIQNIANNKTVEWASIHSNRLRSVVRAIKRTPSVAGKNTQELARSIWREVKKVTSYHNRKDDYFYAGAWSIREAIKQKGTSIEYFTDKEIAEITGDHIEDNDDRLSLMTLLVLQISGLKEGLTYHSIREVLREQHRETALSIKKELDAEMIENRIRHTFDSIHFENDFDKVKNIIGKDLGDKFKEIVFHSVANNQPMSRRSIAELTKELENEPAVKAFLIECESQYWKLVNI